MRVEAVKRPRYREDEGAGLGGLLEGAKQALVALLPPARLLSLIV